MNTISVYGGLVVGSAIGGLLATRYGVTAPFWFAFAGSAVFVVLLWRQLTRIAHADEQAAPPDSDPVGPSAPGVVGPAAPDPGDIAPAVPDSGAVGSAAPDPDGIEPAAKVN